MEAAGAMDAQTDARPQLLGRRHTDAGAHSYHRPRFLDQPNETEGYTLNHLSRTRPVVAGFDPSTSGRFSGVPRGRPTDRNGWVLPWSKLVMAHGRRPTSALAATIISASWRRPKDSTTAPSSFS